MNSEGGAENFGVKEIDAKELGSSLF